MPSGIKASINKALERQIKERTGNENQCKKLIACNSLLEAKLWGAKERRYFQLNHLLTQ